MPCSPLSVPPSSIVARISIADGAVDRGALGVVVPEEVDVEVAVARVPVREVAHARGRGRCRRCARGGRRCAMRGTTTSSLSLWRASLRVAFESMRRAAHRRSRCPASCATTTSMHPGHAVATSPTRRSVASDALAVDLDEEHRPRARVDRDAGRAHGVERRRVEHLEAPRDDARRDDGAHGAPRRRARRRRGRAPSRRPGGFGTRRSVASVKTASVPSLPTRSDVTS